MCRECTGLVLDLTRQGDKTPSLSYSHKKPICRHSGHCSSPFTFLVSQKKHIVFWHLERLNNEILWKCTEGDAWMKRIWTDLKLICLEVRKFEVRFGHITLFALWSWTFERAHTHRITTHVCTTAKAPGAARKNSHVSNIWGLESFSFLSSLCVLAY